MSQPPNETGRTSPIFLPAKFLQQVSRRKPQRFYGIVAVALVLLAAATFIYGGFAPGIDLTSYVPRPKDAGTPTAHNGNNGNADPGHATENEDGKPPVIQTPGDEAANDKHEKPDDGASKPGEKTDNNNAATDHSNQTPAVHVKPGIPQKIWQILLPKSSSSKQSKEHFRADPEILSETPTWLVMNPDYHYTLIGQKTGDAFVRDNFGSDERIVKAYTHMPNVGMKSDLLRYLLLSAEGGVYTDTDTVALQPIDDWVPKDLRDKVAVIVGIEFDRQDGPAWADISHFVQFCQWTIAAAPGHPLFTNMVTRVLESLDKLVEEHGVPFTELKKLSSFEVMNSTGPAAWTDVVFAQLQEYDNTLTHYENLSYMAEPTLYGNILVLPIDGFGMGQSHSGSTKDGTIPPDALVRHLFNGAWRGDKKKRAPVVVEPEEANEDAEE